VKSKREGTAARGNAISNLKSYIRIDNLPPFARENLADTYSSDEPRHARSIRGQEAFASPLLYEIAPETYGILALQFRVLANLNKLVNLNKTDRAGCGLRVYDRCLWQMEPCCTLRGIENY
jgi:hypothetical protein